MLFVRPVKPGEEIHLSDISPDETNGISRHDAEKRSKEIEGKLSRLQENLYAAGQNSVLIVLQGLDTAGKDGTVSHVMSPINPTGCRVEAFKVPTPVELAHDFLWRAHRVTPPQGMITIFNRSYYEDVLVARVHKLVPPSVWKARYEHINNFEALLTDSGTTILKFFLYVSKHEQRKRLEARAEDPMKAWKLSSSDWPEHELYDQYVDVYEDTLTRCSTDHAPWYIVPADHKWFRNFAVASALIELLEPDVGRWEREVLERGRTNLATLTAGKRA